MARVRRAEDEGESLAVTIFAALSALVASFLAAMDWAALFVAAVTVLVSA
jgi:hypothetical protein